MYHLHQMRGADEQHAAFQLCNAGQGAYKTLSTVHKEQLSLEERV